MQNYYDYNEQFNNAYGNASLDALIDIFGCFGDIEQDNDFWRMYDAGCEL